MELTTLLPPFSFLEELVFLSSSLLRSLMQRGISLLSVANSLSHLTGDPPSLTLRAVVLLLDMTPLLLSLLVVLETRMLLLRKT